MKFYLDFEAAAFAEDIISIGCVAETGASFYRVVIPSDYNNITGHIRKLTKLSVKHIRKNGVHPDIAFSEMKAFVEGETPDSDSLTFYCYGKSDALFIRNTIQNMTDTSAINFAQTILQSLNDFSSDVRKVALINISLKRLTALVRDTDRVKQSHNALEDAGMLKELMENFERIKDKIAAEGDTRRVDMEKRLAIQREVNAAKRIAYGGIVVGGRDLGSRIPWKKMYLRK